MNRRQEHTTELVINSNVVNSIYLYPDNNTDGTVTGTAVVFVQQGDDVFIRTGPRLSLGEIISDGNGRSSFAGWSFFEIYNKIFEFLCYCHILNIFQACEKSHR